jgi:hypothetical protein
MDERFLPNGSYKPFFDLIKLDYNKAEADCGVTHIGPFDKLFYKGVKSTSSLMSSMDVSILRTLTNYRNSADMFNGNYYEDSIKCFEDTVLYDAEFLWSVRSDPSCPKFFCYVYQTPGVKGRYNLFALSLREPKEGDVFRKDVVKFFLDDLHDELVAGNPGFIMFEKTGSPGRDIPKEIAVLDNGMHFFADSLMDRQIYDGEFHSIGGGSFEKLRGALELFIKVRGKLRLISRMGTRENIHPLIVLLDDKNKPLVGVSIQSLNTHFDRETNQIKPEIALALEKDLNLVEYMFKPVSFDFLLDKNQMASISSSVIMQQFQDRSIDRFLKGKW